MLEFMGRPTLSWPIGLATIAILGHLRPLGRLLPRAAGGVDRPGLDAAIRVTTDEGDTMTAIIDMQSIKKIYDTGKVKVEALKGIDLEVEPGEFVAIVGPSGSGKSTLMNLIGCLDTPSDGSYRLGGEDVSKFTRDELADVRNRRVGFVFQGFNLLPQISAFENVELPLLFGGVAPKKRRERVEELLDARRPRRPDGPQADRALGRPDAARRDRARPRDEARRRSSPTSPPATSTPPPAATSWGSSRSSGSRARPSSSSPTT